MIRVRACVCMNIKFIRSEDRFHGLYIKFRLLASFSIYYSNQRIYATTTAMSLNSSTGSLLQDYCSIIGGSFGSFIIDVFRLRLFTEAPPAVPAPLFEWSSCCRRCVWPSTSSLGTATVVFTAAVVTK